MELVTIMTDLRADDQYRFHLAKTAPGGRPLDALTESENAWLRWQIYRGEEKERFTKDYIVSFAQILENKFLFGGIFEITSRASEYEVKYTEDYRDLIGRLILEYNGNNTRSTVFTPSHIYDNSKISGIYEYRFNMRGETFVSYGDINHDFSAIEIIIKNAFPDWRVALSSVSGVYLISDKESGKHYVGSAYGTEGIWGRWQSYVNTFHGSNDDLVELFENESESYFRDNFKFCVLEVVSPSSTKEEVINKESLWKRKLLTREHGHNRN